jgi:hypothetical protein
LYLFFVVSGVSLSLFIEHTKFRACAARTNVANTADKHFRDILPFTLTSTVACLPQLNPRPRKDHYDG